MKKALLALFALLALTVNAWGTDVTISSQVATNLPFNPANVGSNQSITVSVTSSSATVTSSAAFPSSIVGRSGFTVAIGGNQYTVAAVASTSSLTLTSAYTGSTGSATMTLYKFVILRIYSNQTFTTYSSNPTTATASVTNNSTAVTSSAAFPSALVGAVGTFPVLINNVRYQVLYVASTSSLVLTTPYAGVTGSVTIAFNAVSDVVQAGAVGSAGFYKEIAVSIINPGAGNLLYYPSFILPATTDAPVNNTARYTLAFYNSSGGYLNANYSCDGGVTQLALPPTTPTSFTDWCAYSGATNILPDSSTYTRTQIDARFPACSAGQSYYFAQNGNVVSCLNFGSGLSLTGNTLTATGGGGGGANINPGLTGNLAYYASNGTTLSAMTVGSQLTVSGSTLKGNNLRGAINVVVDYGAVADGLTNDTAAVTNAYNAAVSSGRPLYFPTGTYLMDTLTITASGIEIVGDGTGNGTLGAHTVLKSRTSTGSVIAIDNSGGTVGWVYIHGLSVYGFGSGSNNHGIYAFGQETGGITIEQVRVENVGGNGIYLTSAFNVRLTDVDVYAPSGYGFDVQGNNTTVLERTYAHTVGASKAGYWIRNGQAALIAANGVDSCTNCDGVILGQSISSGDSADTYVNATLIGCNVEDFKNRGIWGKTNSSASLYGTYIQAPSSGTVIGVKWDYVDAQLPVMDANTRIVSKGGSWSNGTPLHSNTMPFHRFSRQIYDFGGTEITQFWDGFGLQTMPYFAASAVSGGYAEYITKLRTDGLQVGNGTLASGYQSLITSTATTNTTLALRPIAAQSARLLQLENFGGAAIFGLTTGGEVQAAVGGNNAFTVQNLSGTQYFRTISSTAWGDAIGAGFIQAGQTSEATIMTGASAAVMPRFGVTTAIAQISDLDSGSLGVPNANLEILGSTTTRVMLDIRMTNGTHTANPLQIRDGSKTYFAVNPSGTVALGNTSNSNTLTLSSGTTSSSYTLTFPAAPPGSTQCLQMNSSGTISATGSACGGSGSTPGGADTNVQFNDASTFGGNSGFVYDKTSKISLGVAGTSVGAIGFRNATSGTITLQAVTGALGTVTLSLPAATDTLVGKATTDTLTNKTLTSPVIATIVNTGTLTLPTSTDTLVGRATTDTFTNKTLSASSNVLGGVTMTLGSDATGDVYYRNSGGQLTRLAIGSSGNCLTVSAGLPAWSATCGSGTITGSGTTGTIAKFTSASAIGDSILTESSTTLTTAGRQTINGLTISTDVNNTVASLTANSTFTKNNTNSRTFFGVLIKPTFNFGGSNNNTEVNLLQVDSTNTSTTGTIFNLLHLKFGGSTVFNVDSAGAITFANGVRQAFTPDTVVSSLNVGQVASDPSSPVNGDIVYQTGANKFRCYENSAWTDCITAGGGGGGITVGTTTITSGTSGRMPYNNAGVYGETSGLTATSTQVTMTSPKMVTDIKDTNGNALLTISATASAVNTFTLTNAATGNSPSLSATGSDSNISFAVQPKGSGTLNITTSGTTRFAFSPSTSAATYTGSIANTSSAFDFETIDYSSTGTAAANFGIARYVKLENASGSQVDASRISTAWTTATAAAETSRIDFATNLFGLGLGTSFSVEGGQYYGTLWDKGSVSGSVTLDFMTGNTVTIRLTGNITSLSFSNLRTGGVYYLHFIQDATGSRTLTVPSALKVGGGLTLTTTANARDLLMCNATSTTQLYCIKGLNQQ